MSEYRDIKSIAATVREALKREFPMCSWSVTIERFSMGQAMNVYLMKAPFNPLAEEGITYAQLNEFQLKDELARERAISNGNLLTTEGWDTMKRAAEIMNGENWDHSDSMTDYFDVNYYTHLQIGKWNRPFEVTA
jgi:hypothetical protein